MQFNPFVNPALKIERSTSRTNPTPSPVTTTTEFIPSSSTSREDDRRINLPKPDLPRLQSSKVSKNSNSIPDRDDKRKKRPKKKKPSQGKSKKINNEENKEEEEKGLGLRPPVSAGCFHICETLIFEVYQLLGGSLCDC